MNLIGHYSNPGYASVADAVREFFERRVDLQRPGVAFGPEGEGEPAKQSTTSAWWRWIVRILNPSRWRS